MVAPSGSVRDPAQRTHLDLGIYLNARDGTHMNCSEGTQTKMSVAVVGVALHET